MKPGSPFGPNLRAFALYLRFGQAIPFARLAQLMGDLFGLTISEGALTNLMQAAAPVLFEEFCNIGQLPPLEPGFDELSAFRERAVGDVDFGDDLPDTT